MAINTNNTTANDAPTSVVIVEDHSLIRDGLRMLLHLMLSSPDYQLG